MEDLFVALAHPLSSVGKAAAADPSDGDPLLSQFNAAIGPYSTDRQKMDWPLVERVAGALAAQRCDLKVYGYLGLAVFQAAGEDETPYLPLAAVLTALGDLIEQAWARCLPKSEARRQAQLKWFSEELSAFIRQRPPRPTQRPAFDACLSAAERAAEVSGTALGLGYPILRELREALREHERALPAPAPVVAPPSPAPAPALVSALAAAAPPPASPEPTVAAEQSQPSPRAPAPTVTPPPSAAVAAPPPAAVSTPVDTSLLSRDALEDQLATLAIELAAQLRAESLTNPSPYWLLRALRWANHDLLRPERIAEVLENKGRSLLPLPQGHARLSKDLARRLAAGAHAEVVSESEELFAMYPLWLDLQRFVATGLDALGAEQARAAVREQVQLLLRCCPQIPALKFSDRDGTPFADTETVRWIEAECAAGGNSLAAAPAATEPLPEGLLPGVQFLQKQIAQAASGARRFELQLRAVELLLASERSDVAMPIVEQLLGNIDTHRLVEWQPELCQRTLRLAVQAARAAELDAPRRTALYGRVCQISPADAVQLGPELLSS